MSISKSQFSARTINSKNDSITTPRRRVNIKTLTVIALFTAVSCVLGVWAIPIGPISITLGLFAIFLDAYILGWKKGSVSILAYLALGTIGLPVFSGFSGGLGKIVGPGGGYIVSWILVGLIVGFVSDHFPDSSVSHIAIKFIGFILGILICYLFGTVWFVQQAYGGTHTLENYNTALAICVYPFIAVDIAKAIATLIIGPVIKKSLIKANLFD